MPLPKQELQLWESATPSSSSVRNASHSTLLAVLVVALAVLVVALAVLVRGLEREKGGRHTCCEGNGRRSRGRG